MSVAYTPHQSFDTDFITAILTITDMSTNAPISYKTSILPLYTADDINHMKPFSVYLDDVTFMTDAAAGGIGQAGPYDDHGNARSVYSYLTGDSQPQMPLGEAKWSQQKLDLFNQWMTGGFNP